MEERYDDDTVELIDYLRVMWWGKWIILGTLIVVAGLSVLLVGLKPVTYSGSTALLFREYISAAFPEARNTPDTSTCVTAPTTQAQEIVDSVLPGMGNAAPGIRITSDGNRISLLLSSASTTATASQSLAQAAGVLEQEIASALTEEIGHFKYESQLRETGLIAQLGILRERFGEESTSASAPLLVALAECIAELEAQLAQTEAHLDTLKTITPSDLFTLSILGPPAITASGSRLKTTVAVATFLGLMIGILLAFFVHYLLQVRQEEHGKAGARNA